jgi:predicted MFS family arabinose efflux permease
MLAAAQVRGFIGRIGWGYVADRFVRPRIVVALPGIVTSAAAIVPGSLPHGSTGLLMPLCVVFGLTASGWNGVFLAEVARLAPAHHVGEATSGVLTICHIGLMVGPLLFAAIAAAGSFGIAYIAIACVTLASAFLMLRRYPDR